MKSLIILGIALTAVLSACKENNTVANPPVEQEVVTTVTVSVVDSALSILNFVWEDIDGVGGNGPNRIDTIRLARNAAFTCSIKVENRAVTPYVNISAEIDELRDVHQFFFTITNGVVTVQTLDVDSRGLPVGLDSRVTSASPGKGTLTIALSHWESATAKDGTTPSDETDISVTFPLVVE